MVTWRRLSQARVLATSRLSDLPPLAILLTVIGLGTYPRPGCPRGWFGAKPTPETIQAKR